MKDWQKADICICNRV